MLRKARNRYSSGRTLRVETLEQRKLLTTIVYDDALETNWQNWSWGADVNLAESAPVASGNAAMGVSHTEGWGGLFLVPVDNVAVDADDTLRYSIHGGGGGQELSTFVVDEGGNWIESGVVTPVPNQWTEIEVAVADLGGLDQISGLVWQEFTGTAQAKFFLDDIRIETDETTDPPTEPAGETLLTFYEEEIAAPWGNWSWETLVDPNHTEQTFFGDRSIEVQHQAAWSGFYLGTNDAFRFDTPAEITFAINGNNNSTPITFSVVDEDGTFHGGIEITPSNRWDNVTVNLADLGAPTEIGGLVWQDASGDPQGTYLIDSVKLVSAQPGEPGDPVTGPSITIDSGTVVRTISDEIYGLNFADETLAADINLPVNRWGGNATSRYNYQLDATNLASDWYFQNYPAETPNPATLPADSTADLFVEANNAVGADTIMTIGMLGWTPNSREIAGSFPVDVYGPQADVDPWRPGIGNGVRPDGSPITGNDPTLTSDPIDESFATEWIEHLTRQHGSSDDGGVRFYQLGNEPMLWNSTHRDVHPEPASYDEVLNKGVSYATAIKQADPGATVMGPSVWGWTGYFYSALDAAAEGAWWNNPQDQLAHGGMDFLPWYLQEMASAEEASGTRLLDYLDIHYYPQADGVALGPAGDVATQAARLESTRTLWDPSFVDTSWINDNVNLIPRMRAWIDEYYPGTKLSISEYNFGGVDHINGAVTQADVLGIFGREGVDMANMWSAPDANEPTAFAFRMYRNYDGTGTPSGEFGDQSVAATSSNASQVSVFASRRSEDDALTVMLINKSTTPIDTPVQLSQFDNGVAQRYSYDASQLGQINTGDNVVFANGQATLTLPGYSITLLEINPEDADNVGLGDFTNDGLVDASDIDRLFAAIADDLDSPEYDLDRNGNVDKEDAEHLITNVMQTTYGDANLDLAFDSSDLVRVFQAGKYEADDADRASWLDGDWNGDGRFDTTDLIVAFQTGLYIAT